MHHKRSYVPIKPLHIEEVMRFIYILGILLLIAIGFLVYFYRDWILGTIDGFQTGGATDQKVFQLFEQRCTISDNTVNTNGLNNCWKDTQSYYAGCIDACDGGETNNPGLNRYPLNSPSSLDAIYPTVSKSVGSDLCRVLGARMATYNELNNAIKNGLVIDSDKPAMVIDSDVTYISQSNTIKASSGVVKGFKTHNDRACKYNSLKVKSGTAYNVISEFLGRISSRQTGGQQDIPFSNSMLTANTPGSYFGLFDENGYSIPLTNANISSYCVNSESYRKYDGINTNTTCEISYSSYNQTNTETFGNPVCVGPTYPTGNSVAITFPTRAGRGWKNFKFLKGGDLFTRTFQIRKSSSENQPVFTASCPASQVDTIETASSSYINIVPTQIAPIDAVSRINATSYNILDLDVVYSQLDIAKIDFPKRRDKVVAEEISFINNKPIPETVDKTDWYIKKDSNGVVDTVYEGGRRVRAGYSLIKREMAGSSTSLFNLQQDYDTSMRNYIPYWNPLMMFISANRSKNMTITQYTNILIKNIYDYYSYILLGFQTHPIAFLRKKTANFPSLLNTFKIYNFPPAGRDSYHYGGLNGSPEWQFQPGYNSILLECIDGTQNRWFRYSGGLPTVDFHPKEGHWCSYYGGYNWKTLRCEDYTWMSSWNGCLKEYYRRWTDITDEHYIISSQPEQTKMDVNGALYQDAIGISWRPVVDAGNPIPITNQPVRTIQVKGQIRQTNVDEIEQSIRYAICLNFTDTSTIENQIRISSDDLKLYMSTDASGLPEFRNTISAATSTTRATSTISPLHNNHNAIHVPYLITKEIMFILPFHTRNMIDHWATTRFARVSQWKFGSNSVALSSVPTGGSVAVPLNPDWRSGSGAGGSYISGFTADTSIKGSLFNISISPTVRNAFLDAIARFYYQNEMTDLGSDGGSSAQGYATMHKIVDVFQIGNTIFDIRFEEYRKRGLQFQRKLQQLDAEYRTYKEMNLPKIEQISLEENYLKQKTALYNADNNYVWGQPQECGVSAQYIVIRSPTDNLFNISQIVIINSSGQNVALSASVYQPSPDNIYYGSVLDDPRVKVYYDSQTGDQIVPSTASSSGNALRNIKNAAIRNEKYAKEALLTDGVLTPRYSLSSYKTIAHVPLLNDDGTLLVSNVAGISQITLTDPSNPNRYLEGSGKYLNAGLVRTATIPISNATYVPLIIDLGQQHNISVVQIILPFDVAPSVRNYTVELNNTIDSGSSSGSAGSLTYNDTGKTVGNTISFSFPGLVDDTNLQRCPTVVYERFKVARFYTEYTQPTSATITTSPWTVIGYSKGPEAALTFDRKYNAGIFIDTTINGGNMEPAYYPKMSDGSGYNLNAQGSPPPLNCLDPTQIASIFNDYNTLVDSYNFKQKNKTNTGGLEIYKDDETYTATSVSYGAQIDTNTCAYIWTDKVVKVISSQTGNSILTTDTSIQSTKRRQGIFKYPFDTQNFTAYERVFDMDNINIIDFTGSVPSGYSRLPVGSGSGSSTGITIPEMYPKSTVLNTANGFCPALACSDTQVMNSIFNAYNAHLADYSRDSGNRSMPPISKVYKAITPNPYQCEYLVDTNTGGSSGSGSGSGSGANLRKVLFNIAVMAPGTKSMGRDLYGNNTTNNTCLWQAPTYVSDASGNILPGVLWDFSPDLVETTPFLTRIYNYALDAMRPFSNNVATIVNELTGLGSAQLDPAGSGIMNALVKYRTETAAAAGDIRFWNYTDTFGNSCVPEATSGSFNSETYPRCRNPGVINSLYSYFLNSNSGSGSGTNDIRTKITKMIRAGMTDDGNCDFTFEANDYQIVPAVGGSSTTATIQAGPSRTRGLRCQVRQVDFSCDFEVMSCSDINPVPPLSSIQEIPSEFVQSVWVGSGSGSDPTIGNSVNPPPITAAGLNASGSQTLLQPPNGNTYLRSIDYVDCSSDYGERSSNTSLTRCLQGPAPGLQYEYIKPQGGLMFIKSGSSLGSLPSGLTNIWSSSTPPSLSIVQGLVPYTIVSYAGVSTSPANTFEYRITTSDKLDFNKTFIRAGFYTDSRLGTQLAYLVQATPVGSPNAFFAQGHTRNIPALANQFMSYWNKAFIDNKNIGTKIGTITGYSISTVEDSITFQATAATFGGLDTELKEYDIQKYYSNAVFKVFFRIPYSSGSSGSSAVIYKLFPTTKQEIITSTGSSGTFTALSGSGSGSGSGNDSDKYVVQSPISVMLTKKYFRSFRFTVNSVFGSRTRAEISRIYFYNLTSTGTSGTAGSTSSLITNQINAKDSIVRLMGTYANYTLPPDSGSQTNSCAPQYTMTTDPTRPDIRTCVATQNQSYPAVSDGNPGSYVACGIGYIMNENNPPTCIPTGYFQDVVNPLFVNTNNKVPRLRLNVGQSLTIDFNSINQVNSFSFILGSAYNRPLIWTLEGSINNIDWVYLHNQQTAFPYPNALLSFYRPGYFMFSPSSGSAPANQVGSTMTANNNQVPMYNQMTAETIEGFSSPDASKKRMRNIRWKIVETQKPDAAYVHASRLQFHTKAGAIPANLIKITNPLGTRRQASDGPKSLLTDSNDTRWVDYNKSDLLIMFDLTKLPANPIYGFQFAVPANVERSVDFVPARWMLEGSYDGRTWIPLHEKSDRARIIGNASPIYKFSQQI